MKYSLTDLSFILHCNNRVYFVNYMFEKILGPVHFVPYFSQRRKMKFRNLK